MIITINKGHSIIMNMFIFTNTFFFHQTNLNFKQKDNANNIYCHYVSYGYIIIKLSFFDLLHTLILVNLNLPLVSYSAALATVSTRSFLRASETLRRHATSLLPKDLEAMVLRTST